MTDAERHPQLMLRELVKRYGSEATSRLNPSIQRFAVIVEKKIVGMFSNLDCAESSANNIIDDVPVSKRREFAEDSIRIKNMVNKTCYRKYGGSWEPFMEGRSKR